MSSSSIKISTIFLFFFYEVLCVSDLNSFVNEIQTMTEHDMCGISLERSISEICGISLR